MPEQKDNFLEIILAKESTLNGGELIPLIVPYEFTQGTGLMNPSIYLDGDRLLLTIRHVNYVLYSAENLKFPHTYGPLQYIHPEKDPHLRSQHFFMELNKKTFEPLFIKKIDSSSFDNPFDCEFIGVEDPRLFRWDNKLYICGVRRDADEIGLGRMELSEIVEEDDEVIEISRERLPTPNNKESKCEKNWMPILDKPFSFIKWCNPLELVEYSLKTKITTTTHLGNYDNKFRNDLRGGSQVITYKEYKVAIIHETYWHPSIAGNKNATYKHRFILWDKKGHIVKYSDVFTFMDAEVEFCCGLTFLNGKFIATFGYQDNAAFLLTIPEKLFISMVGL